MKVGVIIRGILGDDYRVSPRAVADAGYLEVQDPFKEDLWNWCNWSCWVDDPDVRPIECKHLKLYYCNSDVSCIINGEYYSHNMVKFSSREECINAMLDAPMFDRHALFHACWPLPDEVLNSIVAVGTKVPNCNLH